MHTSLLYFYNSDHDKTLGSASYVDHVYSGKRKASVCPSVRLFVSLWRKWLHSNASTFSVTL